MCKKCGQFITASRFETSDNSIWPSFIVAGFIVNLTVSALSTFWGPLYACSCTIEGVIMV